MIMYPNDRIMPTASQHRPGRGSHKTAPQTPGPSLSSATGWFAVIAAMVVFNTVLGEELLFRGLLLPRMQGTFGRGDWLANGILFAAYHLHMPWAIPANLVDTVALSYPSRRYRSAVIGIIVHSSQSIVILALTLSLILQ
jgi:membrane protease YdiL (CAAX protease family)